MSKALLIGDPSTSADTFRRSLACRAAHAQGEAMHDRLVDEWTVKCAKLFSSALHPHRRTRSAAPWRIVRRMLKDRRCMIALWMRGRRKARSSSHRLSILIGGHVPLLDACRVAHAQGGAMHDRPVDEWTMKCAKLCSSAFHPHGGHVPPLLVKLRMSLAKGGAMHDRPVDMWTMKCAKLYS
jgi:hypothetical protein